ncbi:c-type cytochrome [Leptothrix discophora]|uniref:Cytochrome c n=1 Tax=Leptothrix discophora TaxID=89 RepID=A0ABT9FY07_LEPDI|nr:cytochrome c [Leptothrix discophora]MDP4299119.1 cytochrome c [Leptothrix discophora]
MTRRAALAGALSLACAVTAQAADPSNGGAIYQRLCAQCHGMRGQPVLPVAPDFSSPTALMKADPALLAVIRDGRGAMPAYQGQLREREMLDLVAHLRTLRGRR